MPHTNSFNVGDRVRYLGTVHSSVRKGDEGTVSVVNLDGPRVKWDNGYHSRLNHAVCYLELIEDETVIEEDWS